MHPRNIAPRVRSVRTLALGGLAVAAALSVSAMPSVTRPAAAALCPGVVRQAVLSTTASVQSSRGVLALAAEPAPAAPATPAGGTNFVPISTAAMLTTGTTLGTARGQVVLAKLDPDLTLEDLTIQSCDGKYMISARLRNGEATRTRAYEGGGTIVLERSSGALQNTSTPFASNVPAVALATVKIPALAGGESVTISAASDVRGIFRVRAFSDAPGSVERPAVLPGDGAKVLTASNLRADSVTVNNALLNFATSNTLGKARLRLDRDESYVRIPGLYDKTFSIATKLVENPIKDAYYYLSDVNSTSVSREFKNGGLDMCFDFELDGTELVGYVKTFAGDWDGGAPDGNADPFQVCIHIPMSFNAVGVIFDSANLTVTPNIRWDFNGPLGGIIQSAYSSEINGEVEQKFKEMLLEGNVGERLSSEFNSAIQGLVNGARITAFHLDDDQLVIDIQN